MNTFPSDLARRAAEAVDPELVARLAQGLVSVRSVYDAELVTTEAAAAEFVATVPEGVDLKRFDAAKHPRVEERARWGFTDDETVLVNYRVQGNRYIVDTVFDRAILIAGVGSSQDRVTISRRK